MGRSQPPSLTLQALNGLTLRAPKGLRFKASMRGGTMMIRILCLAALCLTAIARADDAKGKTEPKEAPLEAILTANKTTYKVDLGGKTAEEVSKQIKDADQPDQFPAAPEVDLTLELKNTGEKEIQVWVGGDATLL